MIRITLEEPRGSLSLPLTPSGTELCASWRGAPGAGYSLCLWPGRGWGMGCSGEQSGRCLGDQILSQEARSLARQSSGAQDWVSGGVGAMEGAVSWVGQLEFPLLKDSPQGEGWGPGGSEKDRARHCVALTGNLCISLPRPRESWKSLRLSRERLESGFPVPQSCTPTRYPPLPHVPAPPCGCPWDCTQRL